MPGEALEIAWEYDDGTPDEVQIHASVSTQDEETTLLETTQDGTIQSYLISADQTAQWDVYTDILITVDGGEEAWPFSGDLAALGSAVFTVLPGDAIIVNPGEVPQTDWQMTL